MRPVEGCTSRSEDFGLLVRKPNGSHFVMNMTGAFVWGEISSGRTPKEIVDSLVNKYGIEPSVAISDLRSFVEMLGRSGLVEGWKEFLDALDYEGE